MVLSFLLAIPSPPQTPLASARFPARDAGRAAVVADLIARPAGIDGQAFADALVGREGLSSWNGTGSAMPAGEGFEAIAVYGGDGRRVLVLYRPGLAARRGAACRVRIAATATPMAWNAAHAWCVQRLSQQGRAAGQRRAAREGG